MQIIRSVMLLLGLVLAFSQGSLAQEDYRTLYTFNGSSRADVFGAAVDGAGDVNGDGYSDIIVGGPFADVDDDDSWDPDNAGIVKVFSGKNGAVIYTYTGLPYRPPEKPHSYGFGNSVAGLGDVNGDGLDDFGVGEAIDGGVKVFSGHDGSLLHYFRYDQYSLSRVSRAGDVNGDGFNDVMVAFSRYVDAQTAENSVIRVFSGKNGSILHEYTLGCATYENFSGAGDIDQDGFEDFMFGCSGTVSVYSGLNGELLHSLNLQDPSDRISAVSGAGDVNQDGFKDVIVGSVNPTSNDSYVGKVLVFSGRDGAVLHNFTRESKRTQFGSVVSGAGDLNKDGFDDFVVGDITDSIGGIPFSGSAQVFSGKDGAVLYVFAGTDGCSSFGQSVAQAGDVNRDGINDLVIGAPGYCNIDPRPGRAMVFSDSCPGDPEKAVPGQCGCGISDTDTDRDGIADCNENYPPTDITLSPSEIAENRGAGVLIGALSSTDRNSSDTFQYALVAGLGSSDNGSVYIDGSTLRTSHNFDFESKSTYSVRVRSTDSAGLFFEKVLTITVTDVDDGGAVYLAGTTGTDSFVATYTGDGIEHRWIVTRGGAVVFSGATGSGGGLTIDGLTGTDTLQIVGRTIDDRLTLSATKVAINGATVLFPGIETLKLAANSGNDQFIVAESVVSTTKASYDGGAGTDRLEALAGANTWSVSGSGSGTLNLALPFTAVESLVGGSDVDQFVFAAAGAITGRVLGGAGSDILNLSAKTTILTVNLQTNTASSTGGIEGIETILAGTSTSDSIIAANTTNSWQIDGANSGVINGLITFVGFENISGGTAADTFILGANGGVARTVNGGSGSDLLDLRAKSGAIEVRLGSAPSITGVFGGYTGIEKIWGNGIAGSKIIGTSANTAWAANSAGDITVGGVAYRGISGIEAGAGVDTVTAQDVSYWIFTGRSSGLLWVNNWDTGGEAPTIVFSGVENAVGSGHPDTFYFGKDGVITGTINAGANDVNVDLIALHDGRIAWGNRASNAEPRTLPIEVKLGSVPSITGVVGGFVGIEEVGARQGVLGNKLVGSNSATTWQAQSGNVFIVGGVLYWWFNRIEAGTAVDTIKEGPFSSAGATGCSTFNVNDLNGGSIECGGVTASFSGIENLVALSGCRFVFGALGELTGSLSGGPSFGGAQISTIDFRSKTGSFDVSLGSNGSIPGVVSNFTSVDKVIGNIRSIDKMR